MAIMGLSIKQASRLIGAAVAMAALFISLSSCSDRGGVETTNASIVTDAVGDPIDNGRQHYVRYCASCHGIEGGGDGPVAEALTVPPTDIRMYRRDNDGVFSVDDLIEIIKGAKDVRAHGSREMPVWGNIWTEVNGRAVPDEQVDRRVNELVEYIRSVQE